MSLEILRRYKYFVIIIATVKRTCRKKCPGKHVLSLACHPETFRKMNHIFFPPISSTGNSLIKFRILLQGAGLVLTFLTNYKSLNIIIKNSLPKCSNVDIAMSNNTFCYGYAKSSEYATIMGVTFYIFVPR